MMTLKCRDSKEATDDNDGNNAGNNVDYKDICMP